MVAGGCLCGVALARCGLRGNGRNYVRCLQGLRRRVGRCRGFSPAGRALLQVDAGVRAASGVRASILRRCPARRDGISAGFRRTRAPAILAHVSPVN